MSEHDEIKNLQELEDEHAELLIGESEIPDFSIKPDPASELRQQAIQEKQELLFKLRSSNKEYVKYDLESVRKIERELFGLPKCFPL